MALVNDPLHATSPRSVLSFSRPTGATLHVRLAGSWRLADDLPSAQAAQPHLDETPHLSRVTFDTDDLSAWDTGLLTFLAQLLDMCDQRGAEVDRAGLPQGVRRLLALAEAAPERQGVRRAARRASWLSRLGERAVSAQTAALSALAFLGDACLAFSTLLRGRAPFRRKDFSLILPRLRRPRFADRVAHQFFGGADSRLCRRRATAALRGANLRGRPRRPRHDARDGRHDDWHYHGRAHRPPPLPRNSARCESTKRSTP